MTLILGIVAIVEAMVICTLVVKRVTSYSGTMRITHAEDSIGFQLELDHDPETLDQVDEVVFKVVSDGLNTRGGNTD